MNKNFLSAALCLGILAAGLAGCEDADNGTEPDPVSDDRSFRISTEVTPQYTSYIYLEPEKDRYQFGDTVKVTAEGGGRFSFVQWEEGIPEQAPNPYNQFVVTSDTMIRASFEAGYLSDRPLLRPQNQVFYEEEPRDLYFMIHENRHTLQSVEKNGEAIPHSIDEITHPPETAELPDSRLVRIPAEYVMEKGTGTHEVSFHFEEGVQQDATISVVGEGEGSTHDMNIISFYVDHGDAVLIDLPNGETLLIDTGTRDYAERYVVPFLKRHLPEDGDGNQHIDHVFITHWHYDHFQGLGALLENFEIGSVRYNLAAPPNYYGDYDDFDDPGDPYGFGTDRHGNDTGFRPVHSDDFYVGNTLDLGGAEITVLNAADYREYEPFMFTDEVHRNERSLSIRLEYNGFVYSAGGDTYQHAQGAILEHFGGEFLRSHVFHANHHFHGGILDEYLLAADPVLFLSSANAAVYDRDAYARVVLNEVIPAFKEHDSRFTDNLLSFEVGHTVVRVDGSKDWTDESARPVYDTWFLNSLYDLEYSVPYLWND